MRACATTGIDLGRGIAGIESRPLGRPQTSAFSLIELMMVLTIISILAAIAVPRYANSLARYRADAAANRIVADMAYARQLARSSSAKVTVQFKVISNRVHLNGVPSLNDPAVFWKIELNDAPYRANLVSANFGGDMGVIFNGYGDPDSGGLAVLTVGSETRTVVLNPDTGKAVVQ